MARRIGNGRVETTRDELIANGSWKSISRTGVVQIDGEAVKVREHHDSTSEETWFVEVRSNKSPVEMPTEILTTPEEDFGTGKAEMSDYPEGERADILAILGEEYCIDCGRYLGGMVTKAQIDAALDALGKYDSPAVALGELLDRNGAWDWDDGSDHIPYDRTAVIESSGAWWAVYRGTEGDEAYHFGSKIEALATARRWQTQSESIFWKPYRHRDRTRQSSR